MNVKLEVFVKKNIILVIHINNILLIEILKSEIQSIKNFIQN